MLPNHDLIEIVDYHPEWIEQAAKEINILWKLLKTCFEIIDIEHIGSTAIPNMQAKPIIDILIGVKSLQNLPLKQLTSLMESLEYAFWSDSPDPKRPFFIKGMPPYGERRTHHVHIVEYSSQVWNDHLLFRDYLKSHPDKAKEYMQLKQNLSQQHQCNREAYTEGKTRFITNILRLKS